MLKTPIDRVRHAMNGPTMGTRWSALFDASTATDSFPIRRALAEDVELVDRQMSTWTPASDLMRLNRAPVGEWVSVPPELMEVLARGLEIGRQSGGAFDVGMGDVVAAWGFGPRHTDPQAMRAALGTARASAHEVLELDRDELKIRKHAPMTLDLSGIAKGYAVDRMMAVLGRFEITDALVGLDGEMRACGQRPDGRPWTVALERPDFEKRAPLSVLELADCAVATSGDYRHWLELGGRRLSHTMDPALGGPATGSPASVTVLGKSCMDADAWATALMVRGLRAGQELAGHRGLKAIFIERVGETLRQSVVGWTNGDEYRPPDSSGAIPELSFAS
ncbi:MAG TPA: FAD:protein FMN transferase [Aurantimonas sp.]|uniref:FAD:protein FMN transferase n=1 Tax=Aurantimonas marianensis TaxID=2920428 RepID=A0A9X2KFZ2_9HYPH|nr:FAD:protein FMN transferase [Aurantimonas marianensis]MCP3056319.1 FAD:protein FMN transferase [Aurantimonas marianensis]